MDFLVLVNAVGKQVKRLEDEYIPLTSKEQKFSESSFDSLDTLMVIMYICEAYGISKEDAEKIFPMTVSELEHSIMVHKTRDPAGIDEVVALV